LGFSENARNHQVRAFFIFAPKAQLLCAKNIGFV
jgi:hypothetical protein